MIQSTKKLLVLSILLCTQILSGPPASYSPQSTASDQAQLLVASLLALGSIYIIGTISGSLYLQHLKSQYAQAITILNQNSDDPDTANAELIRFVLKHHIRNRWFDNTYTHYPLVEYVKNLESAIFWLQCAALFKAGSSTKSDINTFIDHLTRIKCAILGDYSYTNEYREFERG